MQLIQKSIEGMAVASEKYYLRSFRYSNVMASFMCSFVCLLEPHAILSRSVTPLKTERILIIVSNVELRNEKLISLTDQFPHNLYVIRN